MKIEIVKDQGDIEQKTITALIHQLCNAESKYVCAISKEIRRWNRKAFNPLFRFRRRR